MNIRPLTVFALAIAILGIPLAAFAQTERGTITGVVMDATKAALVPAQDDAPPEQTMLCPGPACTSMRSSCSFTLGNSRRKSGA